MRTTSNASETKRLVRQSAGFNVLASQPLFFDVLFTVLVARVTARLDPCKPLARDGNFKKRLPRHHNICRNMVYIIGMHLVFGSFSF